MSDLDAFLLGFVVAWTPSLVVLAALLWRAPMIEQPELQQVPRQLAGPRNSLRSSTQSADTHQVPVPPATK